MQALVKLIRFLGPLRFALTLLIVLVILDAPFARTQVETDLVGFVRSVLMPTFMVMLVFTLALDITMTRVFMLDTTGDRRQRYWRIIGLELALLVLMTAAWMPWISVVFFS